MTVPFDGWTVVMKRTVANTIKTCLVSFKAALMKRNGNDVWLR